MAESVDFRPVPRRGDHIAASPRANEPPARAQADRPRLVAGLLRPSRVPRPGETARRTGSPSPAGGQPHHGRQRLRPSGAPAGAALPLALPSAVPARPIQDVLRGSGQPLAAPLQEEMEARLDGDFSQVRVHTDGAARASAAEVGARAYTSGNHIVIGDGGADKHTLAHELTHVIQQRQGPVVGTDQGSGFKVSDPFDVHERAAEANAARVMRAPPSQHRRVAAGTGEQRTPAAQPGGESEQTHQSALSDADVTWATGRHCQSGPAQVVKQSRLRYSDARADTAVPVAPLAASAVRRSGPLRVQRTIKSDTPTGTRVIVNNEGEPFYLALGTVSGYQSDKAMMSVLFDMKPDTLYDVPLDHLDYYNEKAKTKFYPVEETTPKLFTITGLPSLTRFMSEHEKGVGNWAVTGSVALSLWARYYGKPFREPQDMDVLVQNLSGWHYIIGLAVTGSPGAPSLTADNRTVNLGMFKLDLLEAGSKFGAFEDGVDILFSVNVVSVEALKKQTEKRLKGLGDFDPKPQKQVQEDLRLIGELLALKKT